jgi:hypothetical protein
MGVPHQKIILAHKLISSLPVMYRVGLLLGITVARNRKQLLDDLTEKRRYWKLKEEALDRTLWRASFGRGYGPVVRQTTE